MIRHEPIAGTHVRGTHRGGVRATAEGTLRQRVAEAWRRLWRATDFEVAVRHEVDRYLGHRPPEPGDVVAVNRMIRELDRHYGR